MWQQWINGILGLWIILVPFLDLASDGLAYTLVATGIIVAILGFWGAASHQTYMGRDTRERSRM